MKILRTKNKGFKAELARILDRGASDTTNVEVETTVAAIISDVRKRGDRALLKYTLEFDRVELKGKLRVKDSEIKRALKAVSKKDLDLLAFARDRIGAFHTFQKESSWSVRDPDGTVLGQKLTPLDKVGIYVPGGKAAYPSTVLMSAVPAKVAGVKEVVMVTPPSRDGTVNPFVLAAAVVAGVDKVFRVGGAQAVAALAYGTHTIPKVDKIVGPGNIYVATAKRLVFGAVDIDMVAGPSEILIINDGTGDPAWLAADLLAQAEHDELSSSILVTTSALMAKKVGAQVTKQLKGLKRRRIAEASITNFGAIIIAASLTEAARISNRLAPEHLELFVEEPQKLLKKIRHAGAVFLGPLSPEAAGDYLAGPNHTLPTGGTARFSSPLGTYDFVKRTSIIDLSPEGIENLGPSIERFARLEGLTGHARSVSLRTAKKQTAKKKKRATRR